MVAPMTHASLSKRRGQGEDSIYWDATKNGSIRKGLGVNGRQEKEFHA